MITDEQIFQIARRSMYETEDFDYAGWFGEVSIFARELIALAQETPAVEPTGWLRAIDEALVMHDIGVANAADTYEQAKHKLNKLLCVVQDIGAYFAKQEQAHGIGGVNE